MNEFMNQEQAAQIYNSANMDLYKSCLLDDQKAAEEAKSRMRESNEIMKSTESNIEIIAKRL